MGVFGHGHSHGHGHGHGHRHVHFHRIRGVPRLFGFAKQDAWLIAIAFVCLIVSSLVNVVVPLAMGTVIDSVGGGDASEFGFQLIWILAILFFCGAVVSWLRGTLFALVGERTVRRLRKQVFEAIMRQDIAFFDAHRSGDLINRLSADTTVIQVALTVNVGFLLRFLIQVVGGVAILFYLSWEMTLVLIAPLPVLAVVALVYGRYAGHVQRDIQTALGDCTTQAEESITSVRFVRSFGKGKVEEQKYGVLVEAAFQIGKKMAMLIGAYQGGVEVVAYAMVLLVVWYGVTLLQRVPRAIEFGELTAYFLYTIYVAHAMAALAGQFGEVMRAVGAAERLFEILDAEGKEERTGSAKLKTVKGNVVFKNVSFAYPTRPDKNALTDVSLELKMNKVVALVGQSGCGKTTCASLLLRLYDYDNGRITLDGTELKQLDPTWWRAHVGVVSQHPVMFALSVKDNITYGKPDATLEEVQDAARTANAHDFIMKLPQQYDTMVGERGVRLSGGQKQRIAIARAIIKKPKVLVFDEATSALDAESEHLVQEAMDKVKHGRAMLVIAHRLSTVQKADEIVVLAEGKVEERGSHQSLLDREGIYAQLVQRQLYHDDETKSTAASKAKKRKPAVTETSDDDVEPPSAVTTSAKRKKKKKKSN